MVVQLKRFLSYFLAFAIAVPVSLFMNFSIVDRALAANDQHINTIAASLVTQATATLNGTNGDTAADTNGEAFWYGPNSVDPFTAGTDVVSQIPAGWTTSFANPMNLAVSGSFSLPIATLNPNTKYYFVAWSEVAGTWYPGDVLNFVTSPVGQVYIDTNTDNVLNPGELTFTTIQAAIDDSTSAGKTIVVGAGIYNESVQITKPLTLKGAQHGVNAQSGRVAAAESIINSASPVSIYADNVTVDGFTIQGSDSSDKIAGIWDNPGFSGSHGGFQILNNIIQDNVSGIGVGNDGTIQALIKFNLIRNNNNSGPGSGNGFSAAFALSNTIIDSNTFDNNSVYLNGFESSGITGVQTVTISSNEIKNNSGLFIMGISGATITGNNIHNNAKGMSIAGGGNNVTISGNTLENNTEQGIIVSDDWSVGVNTNISAHLNDIENNATGGLAVNPGAYTGTLDATNNYWGAVSGPLDNKTLPGTPNYNNLLGAGNSVSSYVDYKPWFTNVEMTIPSSIKALTAFDFNALSPAVIGTIDEGAKTVSLTVPAGTNVANLVPTIATTGSSVSPASGTTNNFTTPQIYTVASVDEASTQDYTVTVHVLPDIDPPVIDLVTIAPQTTGEVAVFNLTAHDNVAITSAKIDIDGEGFHIMDGTGPYTFTRHIPSNILTPVSYRFELKDAVGNTFTSEVSSFTPADNDAPTIGAVTGNAGNTGETTSVTVNATDNIAPTSAQINYGDGWKDMTGSSSPFTYSVPIPLTSITSINYSVKVFDAANNEADGGPYTITVTDNVAPVASAVVINGGATYSISSTVNLTLSATDNIGGSPTEMCFRNSTGTCSTWVPYATSYTGWNLASGQGLKHVYAYFRDAANNQVHSSGSITVDSINPTDPSSLTTTSPTNALSQLWNWAASTDTGSGILGYWYKITGDASVDWTYISNVTEFTTNLAQGVYNFLVRSGDNAGNYSNAVSQSLTVDTTRPTINLNNVTTPTKVNNLSYTGSATDPLNTTITEVDYRIDDGGWTLANAADGAFNSAIEGFNFSTGVLADGSHTVDVRAIDVAGNTSDSASQTVFIDTTAPTTTNNIDGNWHNTTVTVTLTCGDGSGTGCAETYYKIDGVTAYQLYDSLTGIQLSSEGIYTIKYYSEDGVDNQESERTATNQVKIDKTDPASTVSTSGTFGPNSTPAWSGQIAGTATDPNGVYGSGIQKVLVTVTDPNSNILTGYNAVEATLNGGNWTLAIPADQLTLDGTYNIVSDAIDNAGNSELSDGSGSFIWDSTPPIVTGVENNHATYDQPVAIEVSSDAATITLNGNPFVSDTVIGTNGSYQLIATDAYGNAVAINFTIDIAPEISGESSSGATTSSVTITWTTDQPSTSRVVYDTVSHASADLSGYPTDGTSSYGYAYSTVITDTGLAKTKNHSVAIAGLTAGTTYFFRTVSSGSPDAVGSEKTFTTSSSVTTSAPSAGTGAAVTRVAIVNPVIVDAGVSPAAIVTSTATVSPSATPTETITPEVKGAETAKEKTAWWIWLILLIAVLLAGYGAYTLYAKDNDQEDKNKKTK